MGDAFAVDTDALDAVVAHLGATVESLVALQADLDRRLAGLHDEWSGLAAAAHAAAHAEWSRGLATMRSALGDLRAAGAVAEAGYREAAAANLALWQQVTP